MDYEDLHQLEDGYTWRLVKDDTDNNPDGLWAVYLTKGAMSARCLVYPEWWEFAPEEEITAMIMTNLGYWKIQIDRRRALGDLDDYDENGYLIPVK